MRFVKLEKYVTGKHAMLVMLQDFLMSFLHVNIRKKASK